MDAPPLALLDLPERVVQFGTGAFLRGFVEFFIDQANRSGKFDGRVVMVSSTGSGRDDALNGQDGLYTLTTRGLVDGEPRSEHRIIGSVSRALSAASQWDDVLACARDPLVELVVSNTTEVGIALDEDDSIELAPPRSFPGKLTAFLLERARAFDYDVAKGVVVLPCELIAGNGGRLREIVLELAKRWALEPEFTRWIDEAVPFCNTLVDRIVPGAPTAEEREILAAELGYEDAMLTVCEPYRLFAIEAPDTVRERIRFAAADDRVLLTDDVTPYRERKVRILNGSHTVLAPAALLAGCDTVRSALEHPFLRRYLHRAIFHEIVPGLEVPGAEEFAREVIDRFSNPFIRHALMDITLQATMKMRVRVVPSIIAYGRNRGRAPQALAMGFASHLVFMRGELQTSWETAGLRVPPDDQGDRIRALWGERLPDSPSEIRSFARAVCSDLDLWGTDLTRVPGFLDAVTRHLGKMLGGGDGRRARREAIDRGEMEPPRLEATLEAIRRHRLLPVIVLDDPEDAVPLAKALVEGGLPCAEVTFRTAAAAQAIRRMRNAYPDMLIGAGTVLTPQQADDAIAAGATFVLSPGFSGRVVKHCRARQIPVFPGISTPTEIELALAFGLRVLKFFPAEPMGGVSFLKAISAPYPELQFIPTGGIDTSNLGAYLGFEPVVACGGSWMVPREWIRNREWDRIQQEVAAAVELVSKADGRASR